MKIALFMLMNIDAKCIAVMYSILILAIFLLSGIES